MSPDEVERAVSALTSTTAALDLDTHDVTVVQNSTRLSLRLLPCDVFARVAPARLETSAALEVELAQQLMAAHAPIASLDARFEQSVYRCDGFAVTFWTYYDTSAPGPLSPADYADVLQRLHIGLRSADLATPHVTDRIEEALNLVAHRNRTPALDEPERQLLLDTLESVRQKIERSTAAEQRLHGEPHPGNILNTTHGPLFIDLETCCRGPIEFDLAHLPRTVAQHYPAIDQNLLGECRRLVLALVGAWRWDANDEFPDGLRYGRTILDLLRDGPPWTTLDELDTP